MPPTTKQRKKREKLKNEALFTKNLKARNKLAYAKGKRPKVDCIFCSIYQKDSKVESLEIYRDQQIIVCLNLFPYNPGHLLILPATHYEKWGEIPIRLRNRIGKAISQAQELLRHTINPPSFNVGFNEGSYSGASITHFHFHVVPRWEHELGFIDVIGKTKIVLQDNEEIMSLFKPLAKKFFNK